MLVGIRGAACHMVDAAKRAGLRADAAFFFDDPAEAGRLVRSLAQPGDAILFKGSRGVHVERALEAVPADSIRPGETEAAHVLLAVLTKSCSISTRRSACFNTPPSAPRMASLTALLLSLALGPWLIARLREFQIGQHIREDGPQVAPEESGHADHGRPADLRCRSWCPRCCGPICAFPPCGSRWRDWSASARSDSGTITPRCSDKRNLGLTARQKLRAGSCWRRCSIGVLLLAMNAQGRVLHQHERAVLQELQAGSADSSPGCTIRGPIRWRSSSSSAFWCWCWWARRMP